MSSANVGTPLPLEPHGPLFLERTWLWLIFSIYYFIPFFYTPMSWSFQGLLLLAYGVFVLLFFLASEHCMHPKGVAFRGAVFGLLALGFVVTPLSAGSSSTFFTYAAFLLGFTLPLNRLLPVVGLLLLLVAIFYYYLGNYAGYFYVPVIVGTITIGTWGYLEQLRLIAHRKELKSNEEMKSLATIAERERIARDLHDLLGHTLSSIAVTAELAEKLLKHNREAEALEHIKALHQVARDGLGLVRQTVSGYKHRGLQGEVLRLCDTLRARGFVVMVEGSIPALDARAETIAILTLTELTTNVLRHSKGTHCTLSFARDDEQTEIVFTDNGKVGELKPGNGLRGIQERLQSIGAQLLVDTARQTSFRFVLPAVALAIHQQEPEFS